MKTISITGLVLAALLLSLAPAAAQIDSYTPWHRLLARQCPAKQLQFLSPADLDDEIQSYEAALSPAQQKHLARINDARVACAHIIMGATCGNVAAMRAMTKLGLLKDFARAVCRAHLRCTAQSECGKD